MPTSKFMKNSTWLLDYRYDEHSQSGEDGVIKKILNILPNKDKWCVEFGAWDGLYLTNTRRLILAEGYSGILIEANKKKFEKLKLNYSNHKDTVTPINRFVGFGDNDNLDCILANTAIPSDFDLLSIDIDGNDYHVWKRVALYRPKLVVIEFNQTIPSEVRFVQKKIPALNQGASILSLYELGKEKGYELVCVLSYNAFFVRKEDFHLFEIEDNSPRSLRRDLSAITYFFSGYDGTIFLSGSKTLPWHRTSISERQMQILPKFFRMFPDNYSIIQKWLFFVFRAFKSPQAIFKKFISKASFRS
jgi:hypothetical protein